MSKILIRNANIVSMDSQVGDLPTGSILIDNDKIVQISSEIEAPDGTEVIDASGMIALPGFINAHIHLWQTGLRGIAADWTIIEYLRAMHAGLAGHFHPDDIGIANHIGGLNQIASGTTTLVDWCHNNPTPDHTDAAIEGLMKSGIRAKFLHGSPKPDPKPGQKHFSEIPMPVNEVKRLRTGVLAADDALVTMGLAILGPQLSVWDVCEADFRLTKDMGLIASMHVSGKFLTEDGFERLAADGLLGPHINIVHGNILDDERLRMLIDHDVSFTLTPEIELQMGFGDPLTSRLHALGGKLSLGSDIESGTTGEMFTVTRMALQNARHCDNLISRSASGGVPPGEISIKSRDALKWATIEGARMLGMENRIGSIAVGKQADIVLLDARKLNMHPVHDPIASTLFHASVVNVDTVLVGGKIHKRAGEMVAGTSAADMDALANSGHRILHDFNAANAL